MFYHIIAKKRQESKFEQTYPLYKWDMTEDEVMNEIVGPKMRGEDFIIDGFTLNKNNLERFKIVQSEDKVAVIIDRVKRNYVRSGFLSAVTTSSILEDEKCVTDVTAKLITKFGKDASSPQDNSGQVKTQVDCKKIFIAYGHDHGRLAEVENLINKLGLEPVALLEQPNKGETIIEKFEENASQVCFAIVLYTKCDCGYPQDQPNSSKPRARQNVVFEHGYLMAKLGRNRVCALVEDSTIETPSDISGVLYVQMSNELWKYQVANEMKAVGIPADLNSI
jgi:predicted nucleotide-binding protein